MRCQGEQGRGVVQCLLQGGWDKKTLAESETEILRSARQSYTTQATAAGEGLRKRAAGRTRGGGDGDGGGDGHGCERSRFRR